MFDVERESCKVKSNINHVPRTNQSLNSACKTDDCDIMKAAKTSAQHMCVAINFKSNFRRNLIKEHFALAVGKLITKINKF